MRKISLKILCILLVVICAVTSMSFCASGYNIYTYNGYAQDNNILLLNDYNNIYLMSANDNRVKIDRVYPDTYGVSLDLSSKIHSFNLFENTAVMLSTDLQNNQTKFYLYDIYSDTITSFNINLLTYCENTQIAYYNNHVYFANGSDVYIYSTKGKQIQKYNFNTNTCYLMQNVNGVYCIAYDGIYKLTQDGYQYVSNINIHTGARFVSDNTFVTAFGYTYNFNGKIVEHKSTVEYPSGGVYKKRCIVASDNNIYAISTSDNKAKRYITLSSDISQLYVSGSDIITLTYKNNIPVISIIPYSELIEIKNDVNNNNDNNSNSENKQYISSDVYTINNDNMTISGISPSTTVGEFKRNIYYNGYNVEFIRYGGKVITSGTVGTATIARFYNDSNIYEYELCVSGDITGEGNVNSRDKNEMFDYLLNNITFTGVFIDACNLDISGKIDTKDLVLLLRMIENQK